MSAQTKAAKPAIVLSNDAIAIAKKVGTQIKGANKVAVELGKLALQAGSVVTAETLGAFIDECKKHCGAVAESSAAVYLSNMRGVLRAMLEGYEPETGASIKAMYAAAPKGTGRQSTPGARTVKGKDQSGTKEPVAKAESRPMTMSDVALYLFGHSDDELVASLEWAKQNESAFVRYVKANVAAAETAKDEKPTTVRKVRKAA